MELESTPTIPRAVPDGSRLAALALSYPVLFALSFALKPSVGVNALFFPAQAAAFAAYRMLPLRQYPLIAMVICAFDLALMGTLDYLATGRSSPWNFLFEVSLANASICIGMALSVRALHRVRALRRRFTARMPLWALAVGLGAVPGVVLTTWLHTRGAHVPWRTVDFVSRLLGSILAVVAFSPILFGLLRGFREPSVASCGWLEGISILLSFVLLGLGVLFVQWPLSSRFTELCLLVLPLVWLALRCSRRAVAAAVAAVATMTALLFSHGAGAIAPLTDEAGWTDGIVSLQIFLLIACGETLLINRGMLEGNALLAERERKQAQLAAYALALDRADESIRRAAAADLHDGVGQILAGQGLILGAMRQASQPGSRMASMLEQALTASREAQTAVRHAIQDLCPLELDGKSMPEVLGMMATMFDARYGFKVEWTVEGETEAARVPSLMLYRTLRELIYNAYRHAQTDAVSISISLSADHIEAQVSDRGVGFDSRELRYNNAEGFGLLTLGDRVRGAGGSFSIDSAVGKGCRAAFRLPLRPGASAGPSAAIPSAPPARHPEGQPSTALGTS